MGQVVLVTGASSGIGKSIATHLHSSGYRVYGTSRSPKKYIQDFPFPLLELDVTKPESILQFINKINQKETGVDVLINNAGIGITGPIEETSIEALRNNFETNFFGYHELTRRVIPVMRRQGYGRIVNCSSVLGFVTLPWRGAYNASKFALEGLTHTLRIEMRDTPIKVILI